MIVVPPALPAFIAASAFLAFVPGPDLLYVLTETMIRRRKAGFLAVAGLCSGLLVHSVLVVAGVAALLAASPIAFAALRFVGAAYMLYLAWKAFTAPAASLQEDDAFPASLGATFRRGIMMNVTNPKVAIFFLAFLPQFTAPRLGGVTGQMAILAVAFIGTAVVCFSAIVVAAEPIGAWVRRRPGRDVTINKLAALIFVGLAAKLALF